MLTSLLFQSYTCHLSSCHLIFFVFFISNNFKNCKAAEFKQAKQQKEKDTLSRLEFGAKCFSLTAWKNKLTGTSPVHPCSSCAQTLFLPAPRCGHFSLKFSKGQPSVICVFTPRFLLLLLLTPQLLPVTHVSVEHTNTHVKCTHLWAICFNTPNVNKASVMLSLCALLFFAAYEGARKNKQAECSQAPSRESTLTFRLIGWIRSNKERCWMYYEFAQKCVWLRMFKLGLDCINWIHPKLKCIQTFYQGFFSLKFLLIFWFP